MHRCTTHALYRSKLWQQDHCQHPPKCKSGWFNAWEHSSMHRTTFRMATVMVFGVVSSEGHIMPPHIFEVGLKVNTKVYLDVLKSVVQLGGRWLTLGVAAGLGVGLQVQRDPGFASECVWQLCTLLSLTPTSFPNLNPLDYFIWSYVENITNMTSHNTKASLITAIRWVFTKLPPMLVEKACSQFWIRIEAVTLNRCQFYYIIKLPELVFPLKV